jgi:hypothetical protein
MMKLVEESSGIGELMMDGAMLCSVRYRLTRFQGLMEGSGLPIPGLHRIEGSIEFDEGTDGLKWVGESLGLKLQDGKILGITLVNSDGRILSEGHGPSKCLCC